MYVQAILLGALIGIIRQIKSDQTNCWQEILKNLLTACLVSFFVWHLIGWQPLAIAGAAYIADDLLMELLKKYGYNKTTEYVLI